jgi:hypothetical protein
MTAAVARSLGSRPLRRSVLDRPARSARSFASRRVCSTSNASGPSPSLASELTCVRRWALRLAGVGGARRMDGYGGGSGDGRRRVDGLAFVFGRSFGAVCVCVGDVTRGAADGWILGWLRRRAASRRRARLACPGGGSGGPTAPSARASGGAWHPVRARGEASAGVAEYLGVGVTPPGTFAEHPEIGAEASEALGARPEESGRGVRGVPAAGPAAPGRHRRPGRGGGVGAGQASEA